MAKVTVEDHDGKEKELETVPSYETVAEDAHKDSGLYSSLQEFMGDEEDDTSKSGKEKPAETKVEDDDTKGKKTEDIEKLLDDDKKGTDEDTKGKGTESDSATSDLDSDKGGGDEANKYDELDQEALKTKAIELDTSIVAKDDEIKKLTTDLETAQTQLTTLQKDGVGDPEVTEFFKGIRTDFAGTVEKYREKYGIPDNDTLLTQMGGGATQAKNARLKQFVEKELKPKIEKQFGLEEGSFKFDKDTAWDDPESASYAFRKDLESKEESFEKANLNLKVAEKETFEKIKTQQTADRKWYAENYLDGDEAKVDVIMNELNSIPAKIAKGELKPEDHPLSLRYVLRGYNYDKLVKVEVDKAIADLKTQLKDMGATFPEGKEFPTDITTVKKVEKSADKTPFKVEQSKFSPMAASIEDTLN